MGGRGATMQQALTTQFGLQAGPLPSMPKSFFGRVTKAAGFTSVAQAVTAVMKAYHGQALAPALRRAVNRTPGPVRYSLLQAGQHIRAKPEPEEPEVFPTKKALISGFHAQTVTVPGFMVPGRNVRTGKFEPASRQGMKGVAGGFIQHSYVRQTKTRTGKAKVLHTHARGEAGEIEADILQAQADAAMKTWKKRKKVLKPEKPKVHRPYRAPTPELKKAPRPKKGTFILRRVEYPDGTTRLFKIRADSFQKQVDDLNR